MLHSVGLVGGRGYTGEALLRLIQAHPKLTLSWVSSRSLADKKISDVFPDIDSEQRFQCLSPESVATSVADLVILALPNGVSSDYIEHIQPNRRVLDLSADKRFDPSWVYGLPERARATLNGAKRVSNPGCYATAMQLALLPLVDQLSAPPSLFGVSGFSGAGRVPNDKNNPDKIGATLTPYSLTGHVHEQEVSHHLGREVRFMPHVADFFRGINVTISASLTKPTTERALFILFNQFYSQEPFVHVQQAEPNLKMVTESNGAVIGGFRVDERDKCRVIWVTCIDNLLKGAASQAIQNINLMLGLPEYMGLDVSTKVPVEQVGSAS